MDCCSEVCQASEATIDFSFTEVIGHARVFKSNSSAVVLCSFCLTTIGSNEDAEPAISVKHTICRSLFYKYSDIKL